METNSKADIDQINELIKRFASHQAALDLTDLRFANQFKRYLGSHKSWKALREGKWIGFLNTERLLPKLKAFAEELDGARSFEAEQFFPSLPYVVDMKAHFERLLESPLDIRGLISLAPQGVGKSWLASHLQSLNPKLKCYYLRLLSSRRDKQYGIICDLSDRLGCPRSKNAADQFNDLIKHCKALGEFILFIDEAHNGGIVLFKILKDLIDETSMRFVYFGFPTEVDIIMRRNLSSVGEARQLLRRCIQPIHDDYRTGITGADVEEYLVCSGLKRNKELRDVVDKIKTPIADHYNFTTLASAVREAKEEAEGEFDDEKKFTAAMVASAIRSLCSTATQRRQAKQPKQPGMAEEVA